MPQTRKTLDMADPLFDDTATEFADSIDRCIASNMYFRGTHFVDITRREVPSGSRILDYGCGPGRIARLIAEQGYEVDGVDPSPRMIREARKQSIRGLKLTFTVGSGTGDDLEDGAYSGIICSSVVDFVPDVDRLLKNFSRALNQHGTLILSYGNKYSLWRLYASLRHRAKLPHLSAQRNVWGFRQAKLALTNAGFDVTSGPVFFEGAPFDKRPRLRFLTSSQFIGILSLITAHKRSHSC